MHRSDIVVLALRVPQAVLVFPFMISVERSRRYDGSRLAISHITAITTVLWAFLSIYTAKLRSEDGSASPRGSKLGILAHEATFFGLWLACSVMAGGSWNSTGTGLAGTETALFGLSVISLLFIIRGRERNQADPKSSAQDTPQGSASSAQSLAEGIAAEQEREPRESIDSGFASIGGLEEGKSLLK